MHFLDPQIASLSRSQFLSLLETFEQLSGVRFDEDSQSLFERRLCSRLQHHGFTSFDQYTQLLLAGRVDFEEEGLREVDEALELLTTGETYFFRHDEQLSLLQNEILPALAEANAPHQRLAIWSAGCSSGEEVYSLAMQVVETELFRDWQIIVLGGDLSKQRIEHARNAEYAKSAFRTTSKMRRERFFEPCPAGWRVNEEIRRMCQFQVMNLLDPNSFSWIGRVHLVLCRNVLIYLAPTARSQVLNGLHGRLNPGGYLLLGHSESLQTLGANFHYRSLDHDLAYQRPPLAHVGALR